MASIVKQWFDSILPLVGVKGRLLERGLLDTATEFNGSEHLLSAGSIADSDTPDLTFGVNVPRLMTHTDDPDVVSLWTWSAPNDDLAVVKNIGCRARANNFNVGRVLDLLEFGHALSETPTSFSHDVAVVFNKKTITLPLSKDFHFLTIKTKDGYVNPKLPNDDWPLESRHDESLVRIFIYEFNPAASVATDALKSIRHSVPDGAAAQDILTRFAQLNGVTPAADGRLFDFLFKDNRWPDFAATGTTKSHQVKVGGQGVISLGSIRIIVALSFTVCRERDDFQPGGLGGVARLYPHIMVKASSPLDEVHAGVRLTRPQLSLHCACDTPDASASESDIMVPEIGTLMVADSNNDGMMLEDFGAPFVFWANLFNYYVVDPIKGFKDRPIHVVVSPRFGTENDKPDGARGAFGFVNRDCSDLLGATPPSNGPLFVDLDDNTKRVTKVPRQGGFDNFHIAPRMKVGDRIDRIRFLPFGNALSGGQGVTKDIDPQDFHDFNLDQVVMAPFCPHDCFHMHWRWSNNDNETPGACGYEDGKPHKVAGAVMVPENQDVFIVPLASNQVSYLAQARGVLDKDQVAQPLPADSWQIFCHHGTGYGLSTTWRVALAMLTIPLFDGVKYERIVLKSLVPLLGAPFSIVAPVTGKFALFYHRIRFGVKVVDVTIGGTTTKELALKERFAFIKQEQAIDL